MGLIEPDFRDRVRYTMRHAQYGTLVIPEPEGWRTDDKEIARHKEYHGIFTKFSNSLKFILDAADYIKIVRKLYGVNAVIQLIKEERNEDTDAWERAYDGFFDLSTYENVEGAVSVKFNTSGIEEKLKARENQKVEIERVDTIDGISLPNLEINTVELDGRQILLRTTFDENTSNDEAHIDINSNIGATRNQTVGYPLEIDGRSHENARSVIPQTVGTEDTGSSGMMFFAVSDRDRVLNFQFTFSVDLFVQQYENIQWAFYLVQLMRYKGGTNYTANQADAIVLYNLDQNHPWFGGDFDFAMPQFTQPISVTQQVQITLLAGESLSLEGYGKADFYVDVNAGLRVQAINFVVDEFIILEESFFPASSAKFVLAHNLGQRLVNVITNSATAFYSKVLGRASMGYDENGEASLTGITHGFWVRQFDKLPENDDNRFKQLTTTFKEFREAMFATWGLAMGIEKIGFAERLRVEKLEYFYSRHVLIRLPFQIKKWKRTIATEHYVSEIETGFQKGGEYEEAMGLDEYNTRSTYSTIITRIVNAFRAVSPYRGDSYGPEFARRQPLTLDPTRDTPYDADKIIMDLKKVGTVYKQRLWQDDFAQAPTGVFSPETATNLRYTPFFQLRYRHNWVIAAAVHEYPNDYIRHGGSVANSKLTTQIIGGISYAENIPDGIKNSELGRSRYIPEFIEFDHVVDSALMRQIEGKTLILGEEVQNVYGLIEFINEDNHKELGYLVSVKPNKEGKWKLLTAQIKREVI